MNPKVRKGVTAVAAVVPFIVCVFLLKDVSILKQSVFLHFFRLDDKATFDSSDFVASLSKDLTVHLAYFDSRPRNGHMNVTVLFISANRTILDSKLILGCGVDHSLASNFDVYSIYENYLMHAWLGPKPVLYQNQLLLCYDLPSQNGSIAFALYKTLANSTETLVVYSQQHLFHPAPRVAPSGGDDFTVVVCTKVHNRQAPWFREFIQYQKTIGVDHIDFSVLDTFIKDGGYDELVLNDPVVYEALREGFVSFRIWPEIYDKNGEVYFHSENLRKLGCIYHYLGTYNYAMPVDTDDFFVPRNDGKRLKDYIKKYCYDKPAGSCRFDWIRYFPELGLNGRVGSDGNVTAHLKNTTKSSGGNYKSVHSINVTYDVSFHDAKCDQCLMPGYEVISVPKSDAYVAHLRTGEFAKKRTID